MAGTYDVFLVMHPFRDNVREFRILVRPLGDLDEHYLRGAEGFYCPAIDTAMAVLRFSDRAVQRLGERMMHLFAGRSGLPMVVPAQLDADQRRRFFLDHLTRYSTYVQQYPATGEAVPMVERLLINLSEHIAEMAPADGPAVFDVNRELPLLNPRPRRRLGSVG